MGVYTEVLTMEEAEKRYESGDHCHADRDGDCRWPECPQLNPETKQRHCPLDFEVEEW